MSLTASRTTVLSFKWIFIQLNRLNDGASKYVEQSTLLEPANNATALQHD